MRHCLFDHAALAVCPCGRTCFFDNVQALNNNFVDLWHCPRDRPLLPFILTCDNQDGVTLLDIHLGEMQRLFLFLLLLPFFSSLEALQAQAK